MDFVNGKDYIISYLPYMMEHNPFMFETTNQHPAIGIIMVGNPHRVGMIHHLCRSHLYLDRLVDLVSFPRAAGISQISHRKSQTYAILRQLARNHPFFAYM